MFLIYVNDMEIGLINTIAKFADDTKIGGVAKEINHCVSIQNDLNKLVEWSSQWGMKFNVDKCKVLHVGKKNNNFVYKAGEHILKSVKEEKDLGVIVTNKLKFDRHCVESCKTANKVLGFISTNFEHKSKEIIVPLYKSMVRPHLEYASHLWCPYYA